MSRRMIEPPPAIACAPMLQNWCRPDRPPMITQSPSVTWPASVTLLARIVWSPTMQSCATCTDAMIQLSEPTRVTPPPCAVPRLNVQCSRTVLPSPMTSSVSSPPYFLSCGAPPIAQNGKKRLPRPIVVRPPTTTCASSTVPRPSLTFGPTMQYGPTSTPSASSACGSTSAVGWTFAIRRPRRSCGPRTSSRSRRRPGRRPARVR